MITLPAKWASYRTNPSINGVIVSLTDGVNTFLLGNIPMDLTEGHVFQVLSNAPSIKQNIDRIKKTWSRCTVSVQCTNLPYKKNATDGSEQRLSDVLTTSVIYKTANVYFVNTDTATSLSDCLQVFTGKVEKLDSIDTKNISLTLSDTADRLDEKILTTKLSDVYQWVLDENKDKTFPLNYGIWDLIRGLAKGLRVNANEVSVGFSSDIARHRIILAGHRMKSPTNTAKGASQLYIPTGDEGITPIQVANWVLDPYDYAGAPLKTAMVWAGLSHSDWDVKLQETFEINSGRVAPYDKTWFAGVNSQYAHDYTPGLGKNAIVKVSYQKLTGPSSQWFTNGYIVWEITNAARFTELTSGLPGKPLKDNAGMIVVEYTGLYLPAAIKQNIRNTSNFNNFRVQFGLITKGSESSADAVADGYSKWNRFELVPKVNYQDNTLSTVNGGGQISYLSTPMPASSFVYPTVDPKLGVIVSYTNNTPNLANAPYNGEMLYIDQLKIRLTRPKPPQAQAIAWAACEGMTYSANLVPYINDVTYKFTTSDVIQDGGHIIASLLVDQLGIAPDVLDFPSFRLCYNPLIPCRLNVTESGVTMKGIIEDFTKTLPLTFCWTASGKARVIPLRCLTTRQSIQAVRDFTVTLTWDDIKKDSLKLLPSDTVNVVNHLTVNTDWHAETNSFKTTRVYQNATSQAKYGKRKLVLDIKNFGTEVSVGSSQLPNDPIDALAAFLIDYRRDGSAGILSDVQKEVQFTTAGLRFAHVEVGDRIMMDSTSIDPHFKYGGQSWAGKFFLVTDVSHTNKESTFKCVEVPDATLPTISRL